MIRSVTSQRSGRKRRANKDRMNSIWGKGMSRWCDGTVEQKIGIAPCSNASLSSQYLLKIRSGPKYMDLGEGEKPVESWVKSQRAFCSDWSVGKNSSAKYL